MLRNYFKTTFRTLSKQKVFTFINVVGLALSMVACLLILKYVEFERSFDQFHDNESQLYRVFRVAEGESIDDGVVSVFPGLTPIMRNDIPGFEHVARMIGSDKIFQSFALTSYKGQESRTFNIDLPYFADHDLLNIFSFDWKEGGDSVKLDAPYRVIISSSIAQKFFGNESALGKTLHLKNLKADLLITGVFEDWPKNSHVNFEVVCSFSSLPKEWKLDNDFGWGNYYTYVELSDGADVKALGEKLTEEAWAREPWYEEEGLKFMLQSLSGIHLDSHHSYEIEANGNRNAVLFLSIIGVFIMLIAWVNYVNLSTSKLIDRAKEVGIRKVMGSPKSQLIVQFLLESLVINTIAIILAITIIQLTVGFFEDLLAIDLDFFGPRHLLKTGLTLLAFTVGALLFGLYPSVLFANQKIVTVVKGKSKVDKRGLVLRKGLTAFQYAIAALLLFGTLGISHQLSFIQNQSLGMNIEQTLIVKKPFIEQGERQTAKSTFINRVNQLSSVSAVSASSEIPGNYITYARWVRLGTERDVKSTYGKVIAIDSAFIDLYEIEVKHGRAFSSEFNDEKSLLMGLSTANDLFDNEVESWIGKTVYYMMEPYELVGIVDDISNESLKEEKEPLFYTNHDRVRFFSIKLGTEDLPNTIASIGEIFNESFESSHYDYFFLDDYFDRQYAADRLFGKIFRFFSVLAIIITVLGLFGLSLYNITQRSKEISIRKVLGAEVTQLFRLLTQEYFILLLISLLIALPIGTYLLKHWLAEFANQMTIDVSLYLIPVAILLLLTLVTVCYQVLKVAQANPVESLRNE